MQWENRNSGSELNGGAWLMDEKSVEATKIVRCVIDKDFNEGWKRLGSGDCVSDVHPWRESTRIVSSTTVDNLRLKNHLEWKKQKEMEYLRKREAERLDEVRKKEEKAKEEKEKRRKEKEREEKMREWQEQKAREKEERKREELVLKALEQEIKGVTQTLDKEKLMHEWIRLKNKQRQLESEKKAELLKKEEETRALRQTLAEISYRQWKERAKNRRITLPKNGYEIFGPKPVPVVKEAWNHDFINGDIEERGLTARSAKSTVSMTSIRGQPFAGAKLKMTRSRSSVNEPETKANDFLLRELRIPQVLLDDAKKSAHNISEETQFRKRSQPSDVAKPAPNGFTSKLLNMDALPSKNKLDIYLETCARERMFRKTDDLNNYLQGLSVVNSKLLIHLNEKFSNSKIAGDKNEQDVQTRRSRSYDKHRGRSSGSRSCSLSSDKPDKSQVKKMGNKTENKTIFDKYSTKK